MGGSWAAHGCPIGGYAKLPVLWVVETFRPLLPYVSKTLKSQETRAVGAKNRSVSGISPLQLRWCKVTLGITLNK